MSGELTVASDYTVTKTTDTGSLILTNIEVGVVFWGSYWSSTSPPPSPPPATFYQAIVGLVTGPYLTGCRQYRGGGPGTMMGQWIYNTTDPKNGYQESDIETMLADLWKNNSKVPAPDSSHQRFYVVLTPPNINSYLKNAVGRHTAASFNGNTYYHSWVDYVPTPPGDPLQGSPGVIKVAGHELAECVTDPVINATIQVLGNPGGGIDEIGDTCNSNGSVVLQMNSVKCRVQGYWSAADNACILPEGRLSFALGKNTFGLDEVKEQLKTNNGTFSGAFYLFLDDFSVTTFNSFKANVPIPNTGSFASLSGVKITQTPATLTAPNPWFENVGNPDQIQRIRYSYDITFTAQTSNPGLPVTTFPPTGSTSPYEYSLSATFTTNGDTVGTPPAAMDFELVAGANPYFSSINTLDGNSYWWLSRDLRVFSLSSGNSALPGDPNAPTFSTASGYTYIQSLIKYLNSSNKYTVPSAPGSPDPLDTLLQNNVDAENSVAPLDGSGNPNYNFAIARVRLTSDVQGLPSAATDTRVFFRLWVAPSFDTDFDPRTTYLSNPNYPGLPTTPLASAASTPPDPTGQQLRTIPYFATVNGANDYDPTVPNNNIRTIQIPQGGTLPGGATQDTVYAYYGCFLDIYDQNHQATFPDTHHCLVAQIAYDGSPQLFDSSTAINPGNTDKLAQRNLQIANSGSGSSGGSSVQGLVFQNPASKGVPGTVTAAAAPALPTHRIGTTFDSRPSPGPTFGPNSSIVNDPDLLMIDWPTNLPARVKAHIFWPAASSKDVIFLSARLFGGSFLSAEDANTVEFEAIPGSVVYIPIPALQKIAGVETVHTTGQTYAGLLTIDLPASVKRDAKLNVLVRRITTQSKVIIRPPPVPQIQRATSETARNTRTWRVVSGAFQVTIPVVGNNELLAGAANTLAILKARHGAMSTHYRWYPVVQRLIDIVSGQVSGVGGNPSQIPPSWNGWPPKKRCGCGDGDDCHHHGGHHHKHGDHDHGHEKY